MKVTAAEFKQYLKVQKSGEYNMFSLDAQLATGLDFETYTSIMKNYKDLVEQYKESDECKDLLRKMGY